MRESNVIKLSKKNRLKSPSEVVDVIIDRLNSVQGEPPFLMVSEVRNSFGLYVTPTPWGNYFSKKYKECCFIYDGRFDKLLEVNKALNIQRDIVAIINRDPLWANRKTKSMRDYLPVELSTDASILPYDPANSFELSAILNAAFSRKCEEGTFYVSAHGDPEEVLEPNVEVRNKDVIRGLYLYSQAKERKGDARIVAGGRTLPIALEVARWCKEQLGILIDVWSCPSYTMVSRCIEKSYQNKLLSKDGADVGPFIAELLLDEKPTLTMTRYSQLISEQVSSLFSKDVMAIGGVNRLFDIEVVEVISKFLYHLLRCDVLSGKKFKSAMALIPSPLT